MGHTNSKLIQNKFCMWAAVSSEAAGKSPQAKSLPKLSLFLDPVLARYDLHRQPGFKRGRKSQSCSQKLL